MAVCMEALALAVALAPEPEPVLSLVLVLVLELVLLSVVAPAVLTGMGGARSASGCWSGAQQTPPPSAHLTSLWRRWVESHVRLVGSE
jgi:hypothetical protein